MTGHGGNIYEKSKLYGVDPHQIIDFSANINPLGLHPAGKLALEKHIEDIIHYPDPHCTTLYEVVSSVYDIKREHILFGNGAAELIFAVCRLSHLKRALLVAPTFSEYGAGAKVAGLDILSFPLLQQKDQFFVDWESIRQEMRAGDVLFLGNPNNPDGSLLAPVEVEKILSQLPTGALVVIDESFIDFIGKEQSCRALVERYDSLLVLHSFTKYLAIPGLRLGALYAPICYVEEIQKHIPSWSVNQLAQIFATSALVDEGYRASTAALVKEEKEFLFTSISSIPGLLAIRPSVNFMLIHLTDGWSLEKVEERLGKEGILVRNASNYEGLIGSWMRVAIRKREDNLKLIHGLQQLSEEL